MVEDFEFGDGEPDDAYTEGDDLVSWDRVEELDRLFKTVQGIPDPEERLRAAKKATRSLSVQDDPGRLTASYDKNLWLHDLPGKAAERGLTIEVYPGWETRSRSTGGFDDILGVCLHHTASTTLPQNDMGWQWQNSSIAPIGNISLHRDGTIVLGAAGAANTQGKGGPYQCSRGLVPKDQGNRYMIGIEACNSGVGEVWPEVQIEAYDRLVEVICDIYDFRPDPDVLLHATWAPGRKIDPAGPTPARPLWGGLTGRQTWDLRSVRLSIEPGNPSGPSDMSEFQITNPVRIVDTRYGTSHNSVKGDIPSGQRVKVRPHGFTPADANGIILTATGLGKTHGYFTFWSGEGDAPTASSLNLSPGVNPNNMIWVPVAPDGSFAVASGGVGALNGLILDQVGWYSS